MEEPGMGDWVPFFQSLLWVAVAIAVAFILRSEIRQLREALNQRLVQGAPIKIGPLELGELSRRVDDVENKVSNLSDRVSHAFLAAISEPMFTNLAKLSTGHFGSYDKTPGLERELRYLRDIGYVQIESVAHIPAGGPNLSDHVRITEAGRSFVALRAELDGIQKL